MSDEWPAVPEDDLAAGGWEQVDRTKERVFRLPTAEVVGYTRLYEDSALREQLAGEVTRFFFATALDFRPPLPPGVDQLVAPTVAESAREEFVDDLRERGFRDLSRRNQGRMRVDSGARARLTTVRGVYRAETDEFRVTGWLAVWNRDGFRVAGGAYPSAGPGVDSPDAERYEEELLALVRAVS